MNTAVAIRDNMPLSTEQVREHVNAIQKVMEAVMKKDVHYGVVPGSKKPSLWKPGAEVLGTTFRIAPKFHVEDLSGAGFFRYRVRCVGVHQTSGTVLGEGWGACSSNEEKYKWRKIASPDEWERTPEERRRFKYGYDYTKRKGYEIKQVRAEADDIDNTILKMACKRAQIAMIINVTAAGDIFAQDIEDLPEHLRDEEMPDSTPAPVEQPQPKNKPKAAAATGEGSSASPRNEDTQAPAAAPVKSATAQQGGAPLPEPTSKDGGAAPAAGHTIEQHTLSECLAVLDEQFRKGTVQHAILQIEPWRSDLTVEDLQTLDSTIEQLLAEQESVKKPAEPPKKLMIDGQKRILRARLKSNNKTIAQLEAQFGNLDTLAFDQFEEIQKWITG